MTRNLVGAIDALKGEILRKKVATEKKINLLIKSLEEETGLHVTEFYVEDKDFKFSFEEDEYNEVLDDEC